MPIDAYSLCPGGTGKKIKFCCPDFLGELQQIDKMLEGKQEGMAAGLLDECLINDAADKCAKYDTALKKLDSLLGVGAGEQF